MEVVKTEAIDNLTGKTVKLFNPRTQKWNEHFEFSKNDAQIIGKIACGRAAARSLANKQFLSNHRPFDPG